MEAAWVFTLPLPHSELLEDLEGSSSAGDIAQCFVQRVSAGWGSRSGWSLGYGTAGLGWTAGGPGVSLIPLSPAERGF
jgi:hypothetical protein